MIKIEDDKEKYNTIRKVSLISLIVNFMLLITKLVVGIISMSQAMIADSLHSAGDISASFISFIGSKIATKPRDFKHPYGYGKAEYIFSLIISIIMMFAAIMMVFNSFESIISHNEIINFLPLFIVCSITIILKLLLCVYCNLRYNLKTSILIKTLMEDHKNDIFVTTGTIIGLVFSKIGLTFIDGVAGIIISIWIFIVGMKIFLASYKVLMDTNITESMTKDIKNEVLSHKYVLDIENIKAKPVGDKYLMILEVIMDGNCNLKDSHNFGEKLKKDIESKFEYVSDALVHISPK